MGIFDKIKDAIFGKAHADEQAASPEVAAPAGSPAPTPPASEAPTASPAPKGVSDVDVGAIMDKAVAAKGQKLNWRTSIVDLMKALDLDSSLSNRKELAQELGYTGDMNDSAAMNIWLHKQVIRKLKENGGKVPADLT